MIEGMHAPGGAQGDCAVRSAVGIALWEFLGETVGTDSIVELD